MFIFIAGTTRSGKSEYAEQRLFTLGQDQQKIYIATAGVHDPEMKTRIDLHKARRKGMGFITLERERDLGGLEISEGASVLIESLTIWTANEMFTPSGVNHNAGAKIFTDFMTLKRRAGNIVLVSDDVFSDGVKYDPLTEKYLRTLGGLHVKLAALADEVIEIFAGIPIKYSIIT